MWKHSNNLERILRRMFRANLLGRLAEKELGRCNQQEQNRKSSAMHSQFHKRVAIVAFAAGFRQHSANYVTYPAYRSKPPR